LEFFTLLAQKNISWKKKEELFESSFGVFTLKQERDGWGGVII
jgi:hypothetical protein